MTDAACFICDKQAKGDTAEGGVLYEDDLVYVGHMHTMKPRCNPSRGVGQGFACRVVRTFCTR